MHANNIAPNNVQGMSSLSSGSSTSGSFGAGVGDGFNPVFVIGPTSVGTAQQKSAPVTSPLFDCVNTSSGTPVSSRGSDAGSSYFRSSNPPRSAAVAEKDLPDLPPADEDEFGNLSGSFEGRGFQYASSLSGGTSEREGSTTSHDAVPRSRALRSPKPPFAESSSGSSPPGFMNRLSPGWSSVKGSRERQAGNRPSKDHNRTFGQASTASLSNDDPVVVGLGVDSVQSSNNADAEKESSLGWLNRAAAVKSASQTAGVGLKKWGKASAAKLKQAQQRQFAGREGTSLVTNWGRPNGGLRRYDGRAAKSAADLPMTSSDADSTPPLPSLPTAAPDPRIGLPTDVRHNVHVDVGPQGYTGLPASWAQVLAQFGLDAEEVRRNPASAVELIRERTQYYVDKEAERGHDPESTKRLLESRLGHLEDLRDARDAVRSVTPAPAHYRRSIDNATRSDATVRRISVASTTYSSVLNQGWPASPSWSDAPSLPQVPIEHLSPSLPQVQADNTDDDWGASLLKALPKSDSNESNRASRRRSLSLNTHAAMATQLPPVRRGSQQVSAAVVGTKGEPEQMTEEGESSFDSFDDAGRAEELREHDDGGQDDETGSIMTASKISAVKVTRSPQLISNADSDTALALRLMDRRESGESVKSRSTSIISNRNYATPEARCSSAASRSASSSVDGSGATNPRSSTTPTSNSAHSPSAPVSSAVASSFATSAGASRPESAGSSLAPLEVSAHVSNGLRERRKNAPRIYPPSSNRFVGKEDAPSPRSIGFKPAQSLHATNVQRPVSNSSTVQSDATPVGPVELRRQSPLLDTNSRVATPEIDLSRHSGASVRLASQPLQMFLNNDMEPQGDDGNQPPALPYKQARISPGQITPELIHPDADGFFRPSSGTGTTIPAERPSTSLPSVDSQPGTKDSLGVASEAQGHESLLSDGRRHGDGVAGRPLRQTATDGAVGPKPATAAQRSKSPEPFTKRGSSSDSSGMLDDYEPASDFLDDWLNGEEEENGAHNAPSQSTNSERAPSPRTLAPRVDFLQSPPTPAPHQSPSPALLQGLPTPLRAQFNNAISLSRAAPMPPKLPNGAEERSDDSGWTLRTPDQQQLLAKPARDWRVRSLPPPPPDEIPDVVKPDDERQGDRASIASLPLHDAIDEDGTGPPSADAEAQEAAAMTRPSSRQSRSSSRAGSRSVRRRSSDARRFPVSMHYASGFDADPFGADLEAAASFADLMRARQSMDLDDVMPMNMEPGADVPPVPALPVLKDTESVQRDLASSHLSLSHISQFVRTENPQETFGDLVLIGEGDSGNVFSAIPAADCRIQSIAGRGKVAIKVVQMSSDTASAGQQGGGPARLRNLDKELKMWRDVGQHDNIVALFDVFASTASQNMLYDGVWIVQEFMSMSLADVIAIRVAGLVIEERHMARIMHDISLGLHHLHSQQIIHRDVRSDNILLTFDGKAKLSDFTHASSTADSKRSSVIGTAYWMAPEVIKAELYDYTADVWSLGVVLYEMVEGNPPRVDFPALRAITLTTKLGLPDLSSPQSWSAALRGCLAWCTEMIPDRRPAADLILQSDFVASSGTHADMSDLIEAARTLEAEAVSPDEEVLDEHQESGSFLQASPQTGARDSWTSQSTVHA